MKNIILLIVLFYINIFSQNSETQAVFYNYCPFECCRFGKWIIKESVNVYQSEDDTSKVIFRLNNNDTIYAKTGNLHFKQIGKVLIIKPVFDFKVNDTLSVYNCVEGEFLVKYNGMEKYVNMFWSASIDDKNAGEENYMNEEKVYSGKMIQEPKTVWWVKIKSEKGDGWLRLVNKTTYCFSIDERISGMDGCE